MKTKLELQDELIAALRSGEYKQVLQCLHTTDGYCCLGVACDIYGVEWRKRTLEIYDTGDIGNREFSALPTEVMESFGFRDTVGSFGLYLSLANLNDRGKSFDEIADIIEANRQKIFK